MPPLPLCFGLYKILFSCEAVVHESTICSFPPPTCIAHPGAILVHDYWAVYDPPSELSFVCYAPYNIGNNNIVQRPIRVSRPTRFTKMSELSSPFVPGFLTKWYPLYYTVYYTIYI